MADENKTISCVVPIMVAIIGFFGVVFTAVISNFDKIFGSNTPQPANIYQMPTPAPQVSQTGEQPRSPKEKTSANLVGFWNVNFGGMEFEVTYINDGTFESNVGGVTGAGEWSYSNGTLVTRAYNGMILNGSINWINDDAFDATVTNTNGDYRLVGQKYHYKRVR